MLSQIPKIERKFYRARYNLGVLAFEMHDYTFATEQFSLAEFQKQQSHIF